MTFAWSISMGTWNAEEAACWTVLGRELRKWVQRGQGRNILLLHIFKLQRDQRVFIGRGERPEQNSD